MSKSEQQAIEAATEAFLRSDQDEFSVHDVVVYKPAIRAAIAAYLEATGLERDAGRYRFIRGRSPNDYCLNCGYDGLSLLVGDDLDETVDALRGGEHG